jgi:hypothetical protein
MDTRAIPADAPASRAASVHALLADGSLALSVDAGAAAAVTAWIPAVTGGGVAGGASWIHVRFGVDTGPAPPPGPPSLEFMGLRCWFDRTTARAVLLGEGGALSGSVDVPGGTAAIHVAAGGAGRHLQAWVEAALNIAAGLLLGRGGRVLVHAAAFVGPDGRAWLLPGDTFSGKSSTCANLVRAGWDYLADDQVVVRRGAGGDGLEVEGWHRAFSLDDGFANGTSLRRRSPTDPRTLGGGRRRRRAPLGGVLFPRVEAGEPTRLEPMSRAQALAGVMRQTPWHMADPDAARGILDLLTRMVVGPVRRLRLGFDSYGDPSLLIACLQRGGVARAEGGASSGGAVPAGGEVP